MRHDMIYRIIEVNNSKIQRRIYIMACFLVPAAEAVVTTVVTKIADSKEYAEMQYSDTEAAAVNVEIKGKKEKPMIVKQLKWLSAMLWGGAVLLCFEHIWHGEVVPWFPFLTAAGDPADTAEMLHEMSTIGVTMAIIITAVWAGMVIATNAIAKREPKPAEELK